MDKTIEHSDRQTIETTIGELIAAIADAAREATISEEDLSTITHLILFDLLKRRKS